jgi:putative hydrolase of the HAD superfamily
VRAVLLDALGTLLWLEPPGPALRRELASRLGLRVDAALAERAIAAEIAYYRAHNLEGSDRARLADLRRRCAAVVRDALAAETGAERLPLAGVHEALQAALRFHAFADAPEALRRLRGAGLRLVVVSNWDVSLHDRLAETGIADLVHGAVASAEVGAAKPAPAIFARALALAGVPAAAAVHAGDSLHEDVEGARRAGIEPVLVQRDGAPPPQARGLRVVRTLGELADLAA